MSERYFITGVQLGMLKVVDNTTKEKLLASIEDKQFIGKMEEPYEDYEIAIVIKNDSETK